MGPGTLKIIKYLLAALFIYAGFYKISDVGLFETQMFESPMLPPEFVPFIAFLLPGSEMVLGLLLVFNNKFESTLLSVSFCLMLFFSLYLIILYTAYSRPPCACGGVLSGMTYPVHITFNIIFTILALSGVVLVSKIKKDTVKTHV
jgi:uncharacterized membrane protein YphA (DoxX/SURF4 family)